MSSSASNSEIKMETYTTKSPVLFIIFNRPDTTVQVFEAIRKAKPMRLYIAADGPRSHKLGEVEVCGRTRKITEKIDWECEIFTLFRDTNLGCKNAVSAAIDWFFVNENQGVILEDDCLPNSDFFYFCDVMLEKYKEDTRIRHIGGSNLQQGEIWGDAAYYFSNLTHVWGWASWRRVWNDYDKDLKNYNASEIKTQLPNVFSEPLVVESWCAIFEELKQGKIDTWDYQYALINLLKNGLSVIPNANLISNIGFNQDATHTFDENNPYANLPLQSLDKPLKFRSIFVPNKQADFRTLSHDFSIEIRRKAIAKDQILRRRVKRYLRNIFKSGR